MRQSIGEFVKHELSSVSPIECEFKVGDTVNFINDYGIKFEGFKIIGFSKIINPDFRPESFIYLDWPCYWFATSPLKITLENRHAPREFKL